MYIEPSVFGEWGGLEPDLSMSIEMVSPERVAVAS